MRMFQARPLTTRRKAGRRIFREFTSQGAAEEWASIHLSRAKNGMAIVNDRGLIVQRIEPGPESLAALFRI